MDDDTPSVALKDSDERITRRGDHEQAVCIRCGAVHDAVKDYKLRDESAKCVTCGGFLREPRALCSQDKYFEVQSARRRCACGTLISSCNPGDRCFLCAKKKNKEEQFLLP